MNRWIRRIRYFLSFVWRLPDVRGTRTTIRTAWRASAVALLPPFDFTASRLAEARETIDRQAEEIEHLRAVKSSEIGLSFPCNCGFGHTAGIEFIDSGMLLKCEKCGARLRIDLRALPEGSE